MRRGRAMFGTGRNRPLEAFGGLGSSAGLQFGPRHPSNRKPRSPWTGARRHPRAAAGAGVLAFPWPFRVALTHLPAVFANEAFHGRCGL